MFLRHTVVISFRFGVKSPRRDRRTDKRTNTRNTKRGLIWEAYKKSGVSSSSSSLILYLSKDWITRHRMHWKLPKIFDEIQVSYIRKLQHCDKENSKKILHKLRSNDVKANSVCDDLW